MLVTSVETESYQNEGTRIALRFPRGLVGLDDWKDLSLVAHGSGPIMLLVPDAEPYRVLPVCMAGLVARNYTFELSDSDAAFLELESPEDAIVLTILTVREDPPTVTANLMAPLVINRRKGLGAQIILEDSGYPLRYVVYGATPDAEPC